MARDLYMSAPRQYLGVMVSSTYADLVEHRAALMSAIQGQQLHAVAMETDSARLATVVESSLEKVRDAAAYVAIISRRYGSVPEGSANPDGLSLTHLEFREAVRLGRPILVFIMGSGHLVTEDDIELDLDKRAKLAKFREEAKFAGGEMHRVYQEFNDLASFATAATQAVAELRRVLEAPEPVSESEDHVPAAPELYAAPRYLGSHAFVGREAQLATLSDWARPAGQHAVLLFEAIGGTGKSMLTWEWTTRHALGVRGDWAGRFWYSFYEAGAVMADFCRRALAYMTGKPQTSFRGKKQHELTELLVWQLEATPWLLVLDGLERVLVAYHRLDAAQVPDEDAGGSDEIGHRDPRAAIRPEDDDLLRRLAGASPSRILITSRLVPRELVNQSGQMIPGVLHERLPGLRPADAEALLRSCRVTGESTAMQSFLQRHCDCHPLVTGIVAGLVNDYLPARGDFTRWSADQRHGGSLDVGELDLVQKRNHVLHAAVTAVEGVGRELLATLSLLPESVDYETLSRLVPPDTEEDDVARAVVDLERRGLLQYDRRAARYDLHPVVRAVVVRGLGPPDRLQFGNRVVDDFSSRGFSYRDATSLDDLQGVLGLIRSLLQMGRIDEASRVYTGDLDSLLRYRFEAVPERLALLRPFFGSNWSSPRPDLPNPADFVNYAGDALEKIGEYEQALSTFEVAVQLSVRRRYQAGVVVNLANVMQMLTALNRLAACRRLGSLSLEFTYQGIQRDYGYLLFMRNCGLLFAIGRVEKGEAMWRGMPEVGGGPYGQRLRCEAALDHAQFQFDQGALTADVLSSVEETARGLSFRETIRSVHRLRGTWFSADGNWQGAAAELGEAVRLAREAGISDPAAETRFAVARFHLGQLAAPAARAARLAAEPNPDHLPLARLWLAIGDTERAVEHALAAYRWAWADGEPYVRRFDLDRARRMLDELGVNAPELPPYDPSDDPELPWEADVRAYLETLRVENGGSATRSG